ncbi:MAG: hypothetical protein HQ572_02400 [Candidatus Omnitrophica bacterium]|nr:hypothetical protein [Candidatus Omnitrophota bacterium]
MKTRKSVFLLIIYFFTFFVCRIAYSEDSDWKAIQGRYFTVLLAPGVDAKYIYRNIRASSYEGFIFGGLFSGSSEYSDEALAAEFDKMFVKVEKVLDMYPQEVNINIKIYKTHAQLSENLKNIGGRKNHDGRLLSYYIDIYKTIYTSKENISRKVIAHEIGHVISERYFYAKVPNQIQELLAQYAEIHIDD